jgi:hypothetical protein
MDSFEEWFYANPRRVAWLTEIKAAVWDEGYTAGGSRQRRQWSDEPDVPQAANPYREG